MRLLCVILILIAVAGCGGSEDKPLREVVNGTWKNDTVTVTIDLTKPLYEGVAFGQTWSYEPTEIEEREGVVTFKNPDGVSVNIQVVSDEEIIVARQGGMPYRVKKIK